MASLRRLRSRRLRRARVLASLEVPVKSARHAPQRNVSATDLAMMRRAIALADQAASQGEVPVGAVIYRGNQVVAEAFNLRESASDPTGHAELIAMRKAGEALGEWRLSGCSMAVTLEPCPMCAGALVNARIERLIYGATDPKAGACHTLYRIPSDARLNHRVDIVGGVLQAECKRQLQEFFRERRAKKA
jgi:tRNA(adenine34) deaminase